MKSAPLPVVSTITRAHGKGSILALGDPADIDVEVTHTGCMGLDRALGCGGYPHGRIIEMYGPATSGKTTLALHAIASAQRAGRVAALIDTAHSFDIAYALNLGVDTEKLLVSQPDNGEQALDIVEMLTRSGAVGIVVISSTEDLLPRAEIDGEDACITEGARARLMSQRLRKLTDLAFRTNTVLLFLAGSQERPAGHEPAWASTGCNALKFYASVRLDVRRLKDLMVGEHCVGARHRVKVVKNKLAPPFREAHFDVLWGQGIDRAADLLDMGLRYGAIVEGAGAFRATLANVGEQLLGSTRAQAVQWLRGHAGEAAEIQSAVETAAAASGTW